MRGLRRRAELEPGHGFLLRNTRSIHTFGMRFPIAAVLLDADMRVLSVRRMAPRRLLLPRWGLRHVLECRVDEAPDQGRVLVSVPGDGPGKHDRYTSGAAPEREEG